MTKNKSIQLDQQIIDLLDHLYALRIINKQKTPRGKIVGEALTLLAEKESQDLEKSDT
jgi:hypothetical protein